MPFGTHFNAAPDFAFAFGTHFNFGVVLDFEEAAGCCARALGLACGRIRLSTSSARSGVTGLPLGPSSTSEAGDENSKCASVVSTSSVACLSKSTCAPSESKFKATPEFPVSASSRSIACIKFNTSHDPSKTSASTSSTSGELGTGDSGSTNEKFCTGAELSEFRSLGHRGT